MKMKMKREPGDSYEEDTALVRCIQLGLSGDRIEYGKIKMTGFAFFSKEI